MASLCDVGSLPAKDLRPLANYPPSLWGDRFSLFTLDNQLLESYSKEVENLREVVKDEVVKVGGEPTKKMALINTLERLGVSYLFEKEIDEQLECMFDGFEDRNYDLFTVALHFRMFRQHGYKMSCDIFNKFMDENSHLKETLVSSDVMGMLNLYEAAYLRIHGEDILDEALAFTKASLQSMAPHLNHPFLAEEVLHALELSLHKGIPRVEAAHYISIYEKDDHRDEQLLRLAKLDFNRVQLLHLEELCHLSRWWKELASNFPYTKDRLVECYLWAVGTYFEPHYSAARLIHVKITVLVSILDDTFDAYGTLDELTTFTDVVQRWDRSDINLLPDYMKVLFRTLLDLFEELDEKLASQGRSYAVHHTREAIKEQVRAYYTEAKWFLKGDLPAFDDYLLNGQITSTCFVLTLASFLGMADNYFPSSKALDWLQKKPKIVTAACTITRLIDDTKTYEVEKKRGQTVTGIDCFMKQKGASKEKAMDELTKRVENSWKDINEECLRPATVSMNLLIRFVNFARMMEVTYRKGDGYTHPEETLKDIIFALFINPISV
ncbi:valerianol synthase TPS1A-like [Diospyros lotus]|uniref:valerianol synthase TPS1A-like n=1 Tax=Diospyros lotus TaxID=55363 RepID=UPI002250917B|nr:valerianol synthase TPS1A-like [Diospyros lotus]